MAQQAELDMVKYLLKKGADPYLTSRAPGRKGMTALDYAYMEQDNAASDLRGKQRIAKWRATWCHVSCHAYHGGGQRTFFSLLL
eukprot:scaffold301301_cov30-Prasinocladus_malaysianus.AAC.1